MEEALDLSFDGLLIMMMMYYYCSVYSASLCRSVYCLCVNVHCTAAKKQIDYHTSTHQCLLKHTGYMFRPVNRSSSGLQQSKSQVLF